MNKKLLRKIFLSFIGCIFLALAIGMNAKVGIGGDSLNALYTGLNRTTGLSMGTVTLICSLVMLAIALVVGRKYLGITSIAFILLSKWPVDLGVRIMVTSNDLLTSIVLCIGTLFLMNLGVEIMILSGLGAGSYEALTMGLGKIFRMKYIYIRWICDAIVFASGYFLGGDIGIGTIISYIITGPLMKMFESILEEPINKYINKE